jgi:hypothetical protein
MGDSKEKTVKVILSLLDGLSYEDARLIMLRVNQAVEKNMERRALSFGEISSS